MTDEEILESVHQSTEESDDENGKSTNVVEVFDEPMSKPTKSEVGTALETLQNACLFSTEGNDMHDMSFASL